MFYYDRSFEGLLTAVHDAYVRREFPDLLAGEGEPEPMFAQSIHHVVAGSEQAARVWRGFCGRVDRRIANMVLHLWLSEEPGADSLVMRYMRKVFDAPRGVVYNFADDDIREAVALARKVAQEGHRLIQFVRFRKAADGTYFAPVSPRYNSLPLVVGHFRERFSDQKWILYDMRRGYGYRYDLERVAEVTIELPPELSGGSLPDGMKGEGEDLYSRLWKEYYEALAIKERINPSLRRRNMPVRYWKYMTELQ